MTEYVPRTDDIEFAWVEMRSRMGNGEVAVTGDEKVSMREFSGWLAEVIREAKREGWDEGCSDGTVSYQHLLNGNYEASAKRATNPYRKEQQ